MKQKRAALYVRVSTGEQHTEAQERALREYVQRRGWVLHKIYRDKCTGATARRPGLDAGCPEPGSMPFQGVGAYSGSPIPVCLRKFNAMVCGKDCAVVRC